jgi:hypothetical protein
MDGVQDARPSGGVAVDAPMAMEVTQGTPAFRPPSFVGGDDDRSNSATVWELTPPHTPIVPEQLTVTPPLTPALNRVLVPAPKSTRWASVSLVVPIETNPAGQSKRVGAVGRGVGHGGHESAGRVEQLGHPSAGVAHGNQGIVGGENGRGG